MLARVFERIRWGIFGQFYHCFLVKNELRVISMATNMAAKVGFFLMVAKFFLLEGDNFFWALFTSVLHGARVKGIPRRRPVLRAQDAHVLPSAGCASLACGYENCVPSGLRDGIAVTRSPSPTAPSLRA
jgi:hypothetical protein